MAHEDALCFNATEIHFPLLNNCRVQQRARPLQLINKTEDYVASKIFPAKNTSVTQTMVVVPPKSRFTVFLIPDKSRTTTDITDGDNFTVYSRKIDKRTNVTEELFIGSGESSIQKAVIKSSYLDEEKPALPFLQPGVIIDFPVNIPDMSLVTTDLHSTKPWLLWLCSSNNAKALQIGNYETQEILFQQFVQFDAVKFWGEYVVAGNSSGVIEVYSLTQYTLTPPHVNETRISLIPQRILSFEAKCHAITSLAISPDCQHMVTSGVQGKINVWDYNYKHVGEFEGHSDAVTEVKFNPDQYNIFASASKDCKVKIWNLSSTNPDAELVGHSSEVTCVDFIPRKSWLISGSKDNTVQVWDYLAKTCITKLVDICNVRAICSHPKIPIIFSGLDNGTIRLWNTSANSIENSFGGYKCGAVCSIDRKDTRYKNENVLSVVPS